MILYPLKSQCSNFGQIHRAMLGATFALPAPTLALMLRHPGIVSTSMPNRRMYGAMARAVAATKP